MRNTRLLRHCYAFPEDMTNWVEAQAKHYGMSKNSFVQMKLRLSMETEQAERLRRLEVRVTELERVSRNGVLH